MPRGPRLDAPGTLHHVIIRGIEKRPIVRDDADRSDFVSRLGRLAIETQTSVFAWALMGHHAHLLLRSGALLQLVVGLLEILLAFWVAGNHKEKAFLLVVYVGIVALSRGITQIFLAFKLKGPRRRLAAA